MEASTAVSSRLIGAFFVEKGLVTQEQLELALQKQGESGERLGEIIVAEFGVSRLELASVLAEQWAEFERDSKAREAQAAPAPSPTAPAEGAPREDAPAPEPLLRRPIGEIFLERGFVTRDDLDRALDVQRETGTRLGEVLVEQGSLTRLDLASALAEQWSALQKLRPPEPVAPEPWQNGAAVAPAGPAEVPNDLRRSLEELEERVRAVERVSAATPWNEDLRLLGDNVRAAIATVEERVTKTATRVDPAQLEALGAALDELRERVQDPAARLDAVERRLGELPTVEALEGRLEQRLAELRAALEGSAAEAVPAGDLASLRERVDELAARVVVPEELEELRAQVAALAGGSSSADEVAVLHAVVDELAGRSVTVDQLAELQARLDEMALRVVVPEALAEVRAELTALSRATPPAEDLAALRAAVDELSAAAVSPDELAALRARVEDLAGVARQADAAKAEAEALRLEVDAISALRPRVEDLAAQLPGEHQSVVDLRRALDELAARVSADVPREEHDALVRDLVGRLDELSARVHTIDTRNTEPSGPRLREILDDLRAEIGALAERPVLDTAALEERFAALEQSGPDPAVQSLSDALEEQRARLDGRLDDLAARQVDPVAVDELRSRIAEIAARVGAAVDAAALEERLADLEGRLADASHLDELRAELQRLAGTVAEERAAGERALHARVDELAAATPATEEIAGLRARLDELAVREGVDDEARARLDDVSARLELALAATGSLDELRRAVERIEAHGAEESGTTAGRLAAIEEALTALDGVEWRLQTRMEESVAVRASDLEQRLDGSLRRLDALDSLEERIAELKADLDAHPGTGALEAVANGLRAELARLADRLGRQERALAELPEPADPTQRLDDLGLRLDGQARLAADRLGALGDDLRARIEDVDARLQGLAHRDEVRGSIAEHAASVTAELEALRRAGAEREQALAEQLAGLADRGSLERLEERLEERLAEHDRQLADTSVRDELSSLAGELRDRSVALEDGLRATGESVDAVRADVAGRVDETADALRREFDGRATELHERLSAQESGLAGVRSQLDDLRAAAAGQEEWRAQVESMVGDRLAELEQRLAAEATETRERVERTEQALATEVGSLASRLDELLALRHQDLQAARGAADTLAARVDELQAVRGEEAEAAHAAVGELSSRMEGLAASLRSESAAAAAAARTVSERVDQLEGLRADDLETARIAGAELVARLDDLAIRTAAAAAEADRALRSELSTLAATVEEREAAGVEAREELRLELERAASSMGWRLERIEEALASDDQQHLRESVTELERRLEQQLAQHDEQVRVTERALRKGLASLGERLAETQSNYLDAGNALRRSIERLGAAVVEADARMAEQIPVSEVEGYVAFAPTAEGYRLVQLPGRAPELGVTVEVDGVDGPLVVTRLGRSPLPLDSRPCAYLDRP